MARTTHKQVVAVFTQLMNALDTTDYALDFYGLGGGYMVIGRHDGAHPGHTPFGSRRRSAREMVDVMWFAIYTLELQDRLQTERVDEALKRTEG